MVHTCTWGTRKYIHVYTLHIMAYTSIYLPVLVHAMYRHGTSIYKYIHVYTRILRNQKNCITAGFKPAILCILTSYLDRFATTQRSCHILRACLPWPCKSCSISLISDLHAGVLRLAQDLLGPASHDVAGPCQAACQDSACAGHSWSRLLQQCFAPATLGHCHGHIGQQPSLWLEFRALVRIMHFP
jgi:hypothetical protein